MTPGARRVLVGAQEACRRRGGQEIAVTDVRTALADRHGEPAVADGGHRDGSSPEMLPLSPALQEVLLHPSDRPLTLGELTELTQRP